MGRRQPVDELQNFGAGTGNPLSEPPPPWFFVNIADTGLKVERNQRLWKC